MIFYVAHVTDFLMHVMHRKIIISPFLSRFVVYHTAVQRALRSAVRDESLSLSFISLFPGFAVIRGGEGSNDGVKARLPPKETTT